jgi:hypothetical protein
MNPGFHPAPGRRSSTRAVMVATMTNPSVILTQAGALRKNAGTASAAEMTRVTMIAISAGRLPRRG